MSRTLRGDHCQCAGCGEYFHSTAAFDKHRTDDGAARRCITLDEMRAKSMAVSSTGWWITSARPILTTAAIAGQAIGATPYLGSPLVERQVSA